MTSLRERARGKKKEEKKRDLTEKELKVLSKANRVKNSPLIFSKDVVLDCEHKLKKPDADRSGYSIKNLIRYVMKMSNERYTLYKKNRHNQCRPSARRSSIDIWRMCMEYQPDLDIFSIMRAIYELVETDSEFDENYCDNVRKRVFENPAIGGEGFTHDEDVVDELGLLWADWKDIGVGA